MKLVMLRVLTWHTAVRQLIVKAITVESLWFHCKRLSKVTRLYHIMLHASLSPSRLLSPQSPPQQAVDFEREWLDEFGHACPKFADYGTQCPKGHSLVPFPKEGGEVSAHAIMCRVCHSHTEREHASQWLVCSRAGCCATYAVCERCVEELKQPRSAKIGDDFPSLV
jgi:hypothetical protein